MDEESLADGSESNSGSNKELNSELEQGFGLKKRPSQVPVSFNGYFPTMAPMPSVPDEEFAEYVPDLYEATSSDASRNVELENIRLRQSVDKNAKVEAEHFESDTAHLLQDKPVETSSSASTACLQAQNPSWKSSWNSNLPFRTNVSSLYNSLKQTVREYTGRNTARGRSRSRHRRNYGEKRCQWLRNPENCMFLPVFYFGILFFTFIIYQIRILSKGSRVCNGNNAYCSTHYNELTQIATFRSYAVGEHVLATQENDIGTQLSDGIRVFYVDLEWRDSKTKDELDMCATRCLYMDGGRFLDALYIFKNFLDATNDEIITLFLKPQSGVAASDIANVFKSSGIIPYAYSRSLSLTSWPTLLEMITNDNKLVVFLDSDVDYSRWPWMMRELDFVWENNLIFSASSNFSDPHEICSIVAPSNTPRPLNLLSHVVFAPGDIDEQEGLYPDRTLSSEFNTQDSILSHAQLCSSVLQNQVYSSLALDYKPNFILVPFYNRGNTMLAATIITLGGTVL